MTIERPVEEEIINKEYCNKVIQSLYELPKQKDLKAVELVVVERKKLREAGVVMGFTKESVRQHKVSGLRAIRARLKSWGFDL